MLFTIPGIRFLPDMKVLIVSNNVYLRGNGVCTAVQSLKSRLLKAGIDVRLLAGENPEAGGPQPDYPLKPFIFPFFQPIITANGYSFSRLDKKMIREAVRWADVVHLMEGFPLQSATVKAAEEAGKPCVGTYHIFTENITANLGIGYETFVNRLINRWWSSAVYNRCAYVQCPSRTVRDHLQENGYTAPLKVISNGIEPVDRHQQSEGIKTDPFRILCTGRLSNEKSQMTLIKAMRHSRHAGEIGLHFAGNGPKARKIMKAAHRLVEDGVLVHEPVFGFYTQKELRDLAATSYLYVHCATIEVEGLSCLEALQQGAVPVIARSRLSAASQFALDERSVFTAGDPKELAERIDWWIEHPEERMNMGKLYVGSVKTYDAADSTSEIIRMYEEAIDETDK